MPKKTKTKESRAMVLYRKKTQAAMKKIGKPEEFRQSDRYIAWVFNVAEALFENDLDQYSQDWLVRHGGRLTSVYAYLGNKAAYARAERDVYEQKLQEVMGEMLLEKLDEQYKVTEARENAKQEVAPLRDVVICKELTKNNYENLLSASDRLISFIQSALNVKKQERMQSRQLQDNQG